MDVYGPPTITVSYFGARLTEVSSPVLKERPAAEYYNYFVGEGIDPAFGLAIFFNESSAGTNPAAIVVKYATKNWSNCRSLRMPGLPGKIISTPRGNFVQYQSWLNGVKDLCYRLKDPKYAYAGKRTVEEIVPIMAPPGDFDNDPLAYVRKVIAMMTAWKKASAPVVIIPSKPGGTAVAFGHVPKPPIDNHIIGIPPKVNGVGVDRIASNRRPQATVLHSMAGTLDSCDNYFPGATVEALTDFGVGQVDYKKSGFARIIQWTDIYGKLMPWASGPVRVPEGDGPRFLQYFGGAGAVNNVGVSIEHDDTTLANGSRADIAAAPVTVYQWSASIWLQAWLHAEVFGQTAATYDWNMHHREFCGSSYKTCPRPRIYDYTDEYQTAVRQIMQHFQQGTPYPTGGIIVAGLRINLPPEGISIGGAPKVDITQVMPTGEYIHPYFAERWNMTEYGYPIQPAVGYTDKRIRQLFEYGALECDVNGNDVKKAGIGQAMFYMTGDKYPDWPTVHPDVARAD
jgi:hypothetical protein